MIVAVLGGWLVGRQTLKPLGDMAAQAASISEDEPSARLVTPNPRDELGRLAQAFNGVLERLARVLHAQRQFMADASHELRTPVSIARTAIDVVATPGREEAEYIDALGVVAQQMRRLSRIVDDLFTLARADASGLPLLRAPLYLDELVADCVKEARVLAASKPVALDWSGPADLEIEGDERLLRQMLMNLLHNAVRYTPAAGSARVDLATADGAVEVGVTDTGAGVPDADRERIFERFVRLDAARSGEGAGLGLPIARAIAEAHGGTLVLARSDSSGSAFRVTLPLPHA
jgi:two-component system, OmpR family, sensor kinase